jgi:hypothetical protein
MVTRDLEGPVVEREGVEDVTSSMSRKIMPVA